MSLEKLIEITKSDQGFFQALYASKKFSITVMVVSTLLLFAAKLVNPIAQTACVAGATLITCAYVLGQSYVEGKGVTDLTSASVVPGKP